MCYFLKSSRLFNSFYSHFLFIRKTLRLNDVQTRTAVNAKISVFVLFVEAIIYLLLFDLHDCTFKRIKVDHCKTLKSNKQSPIYEPFHM